jgi:hypothetical protein
MFGNEKKYFLPTNYELEMSFTCEWKESIFGTDFHFVHEEHESSIFMFWREDFRRGWSEKLFLKVI